MDRRLEFEVRQKLETGDIGEGEGGFHMIDIGGGPVDADPSPVSASHKAPKPMTRQERTKLAEGMAARLMDYYMQPEILNDMFMLNPIRDGIPQCTKHPFVSGSSTQFGCIYGCGANERDSAGNLPVAKDNTLGDTWNWVRALVIHAVTTQDKRVGHIIPPDLTPGR
jgi:hypothetical protein